MAGKVVNSSFVFLSKFVHGGQESAPKTATSHIRKTLDKIRHGFAFNFLRMMAPFTLSISFLQLV